MNLEVDSEERQRRILFEVERNKSRQSLNLSWKDRNGDMEEEKSPWYFLIMNHGKSKVNK